MGLDELDIDSEVKQEKVDREQVYTSLAPSDKMWLKNTANRMGCSMSEAMRRLVYNARMRDTFDEEKLI